MQNLTERQSKILNFIEDFISSHGFAPTIREIANHFKIVSLNAVRQHLLKLQDKGLIDIASHQSRGIKLPGLTGIRIPVVGRVAAGVPILAAENIESFFAVDRTFLRQTEDIFALKVKGDSMTPAIQDGDYVLVKCQDSANLGETVVAVIENEATVKVLSKIDNRLVLHALNPKYKDILLSEETIINGKVIGLIRKFQ
jgi:repressor LexA